MTDPQADQPVAAVTMLTVTNNNDFTITDMFDGVPVTFAPGVPVDCSPAICEHLFGWPADLPVRALKMAARFGWSGKDYLRPEGPGDTVPRYQTLAEKIVITPVYYKLVKFDPNAPIPVDLGDEESDRPVATAPEETTKVGRKRRNKAPVKSRRAGAGDRDGLRLGSR